MIVTGHKPLVLIPEFGTPIVNRNADTNNPTSYEIDQKSGFKIYPWEVVRQWDGVFTREQSNDPKHPQLDLKSRSDKQIGAQNPEGDDVFIGGPLVAFSTSSVTTVQGKLVLTGTIPTLLHNSVRLPAAATISVSGSVSTVLQTFSIDVPIGSISASGQTPVAAVFSISGETINHTVTVGTAIAGVRFNTDGTIDRLVNITYTQIDGATDLVIPNSALLATDEVRLQANDGTATFSGASVGTWVAFSTNREWTYERSTDGTDTGNWTFEVRRGSDRLTSGIMNVTADNEV